MRLICRLVRADCCAGTPDELIIAQVPGIIIRLPAAIGSGYGVNVKNCSGGQITVSPQLPDSIDDIAARDDSLVQYECKTYIDAAPGRWYVV